MKCPIIENNLDNWLRLAGDSSQGVLTFTEWAKPLKEQLHDNCSNLLIKFVESEEDFDPKLTMVSALLKFLKSLSIYFVMKMKVFLEL